MGAVAGGGVMAGNAARHGAQGLRWGVGISDGTCLVCSRSTGWTPPPRVPRNGRLRGVCVGQCPHGAQALAGRVSHREGCEIWRGDGLIDSKILTIV